MNPAAIIDDAERCAMALKMVLADVNNGDTDPRAVIRALGLVRRIETDLKALEGAPGPSSVFEIGQTFSGWRVWFKITDRVGDWIRADIIRGSLMDGMDRESSEWMEIYRDSVGEYIEVEGEQIGAEDAEV